MRVLTFDVGSNFTRYAVFTDGRQGVRSSVATPSGDADSFYRMMASIVEQQHEPVDGIGISLPGFVDARRQRAITAGPLRMLYRQAVGEELNRRLDRRVPVWLENDANCAAMAERLSGNARSIDDFVVVTVTDTGVGGALFLDGRIRRGRDWRAGEIGMMPWRNRDGEMHTLHEYTSSTVLAQRYAEEFGVALDGVVAQSLLRRMDDHRVRALIEQWADDLAVLIFDVVAVLDPECVLLGGPICQEVAFLPLIRAALERIQVWKDFRTPVKRCRHSGNAGLLGAYYAFMTELGGATDGSSPSA